MADAVDSKSTALTGLRVRLPPPVPALYLAVIRRSPAQILWVAKAPRRMTVERVALVPLR